MKIKRKDLNRLVATYLKDEVINEGTFGGSFGGAQAISFCDVSSVSPTINQFLKTLEKKNKDEMLNLLYDELKNTSNGIQIEHINNNIKQLNEEEESFWTKLTGNRLFNKLVKLTSGMSSILFMLGTAECALIVATAENFIVNVAAPILGLNSVSIKDRIQKEKAASSKSQKNSDEQEEASEQQEEEGPTSYAWDDSLSNALYEAGIVDRDNRVRKIPEQIYYNSGLNNFHFDLFELLATNSYNEYLDNPSKRISSDVKTDIQDRLNIMASVNSNSLKDWETAFLLATPGTDNDQKIRRILRNLTPQSSEVFKSPDDATFHIAFALKALIKVLPFER